MSRDLHLVWPEKMRAAGVDSHTESLRRLNAAHARYRRVAMFWCAVAGAVAGFLIGRI